MNDMYYVYIPLPSLLRDFFQEAVIPNVAIWFSYFNLLLLLGAKRGGYPLELEIGAEKVWEVG